MPIWFDDVSPVRMKPAWAMLEYASIRLMSDCAIASTLPRITDAAARTQITGVQSHVSGWNATSRTRISARNAATFVAADMNAVTGVGAPWYTSGVHWWNGTADTLNPNPIARKTNASSASAWLPV